MRDDTRAYHGARPADRTKPPGVPGGSLRRIGAGRVAAGYQFPGGQLRHITFERRAYAPGDHRHVRELRRAHLRRAVQVSADGDALAPALTVVLVFEQQLGGLCTYLRRCVDAHDAAVIRVELQPPVRVAWVIQLADGAGR